MKIEERGYCVQLRDNPAILWLPAGLFGFVGATFIVLAAKEAGRGGPPLATAGAMAVGSMGVFMGLFAAREAERIVVDIDRLHRRVTRTTSLLWRRCSQSWSFDEIADFELEEARDEDGDPIWRAWMRLANGERIAMMAIFRPGRDATAATVERARAALGR